jgi:hypothetical protein
MDIVHYATDVKLPKVHHQQAEILDVLKKFSGATQKQIIEVIDACPERKERMKSTQPTKANVQWHLKVLLKAGAIRGELKTAGSIEIEMPPKKSKNIAVPTSVETETPVVAPVAAPVAVPVPKKKAAPKKKPATVAADTVVQIPVKKKEIGGTTYYLGPEDKVFDMKFKYVGRYDKEADEVNRDILDSD